MSRFETVWVEGATRAPRIVAVLGGAAVRGVVVLVLAAAVVRFWPRTSAAQRHAVWVVACGSLLLLPVLPLIVPVWRVSVPVLPTTPVPPLVNRVQRAAPHAVSMSAVVVRSGTRGGSATTAGWVLQDWLLLALVGWGIGTVVVLTVLVDSQRQVRHVASEAVPLTDVRMLDTVARAKSTVRIVRRVPVRLHASAVPMVCGVFRPTIVLPVSADTWGEKRLYNVLVHEFAHIKRWDSLTQTVASLACALYWYNPFVWLAVRRLQIEQEQACDDVVLNAGGRPREYATDLLELTHLFQPTGAMSLATLPFARPSELEMRMQSLIDRSRHRSNISRWGIVAVWSASVGILYPLVGLTPQGHNYHTSTQDTCIRGSNIPFLVGIPIHWLCRDASTLAQMNIPRQPFEPAMQMQQMKKISIAKRAAILASATGAIVVGAAMSPQVQHRLTDPTVLMSQAVTVRGDSLVIGQRATTAMKAVTRGPFGLNAQGMDSILTILGFTRKSSEVTILVDSGAPLVVVNERIIQEGTYITQDRQRLGHGGIYILGRTAATDLYGEKGKNGALSITTGSPN